MKAIISKNAKQYKANLHCHSILSDGNLTPEKLKEMYKREGYSILAITDHERPCDHTHMSDKNFLMLTGYEAYIRPSEKAIFNPFTPEVHINLFAKEPHNLSYVNYDPCFDKYTKDASVSAAYKKVGSAGKRKYTVEYVNRFLKDAKDNGYLCSYNHPVWSCEDYDTISSYKGFFSMEMHNYSSYISGLSEYNGALYDSLLRGGSRIFCHSADDNHNKFGTEHPASDSFGGYTMILAKQLGYSSVIDALENGNFYSSMGPRIYEFTIDGRNAHVETSPARQITALFGGKSTAFSIGTKNAPVSSLDFEIPEAAKYVRINVCDFEGKYADTHAYDID